MKKTVLAASALVVATSLALTGCATGTSGSNASSSSGAYSPTKKLSGALSLQGFNHKTDEVSLTRWNRAVSAVGGKVAVKSDDSDFNSQTFLASVASGKAPDLIYLDRAQIGTLAAKKAIMPLSSCISGEQIDTKQYLSSALSQVTLNNTVYGIPEFNSVDVVIAANDVLKKAGVSLADVDGSNWSALAAASKKMASIKNGKVAVLGFDSKLPEFLPLWAKANGVDLLSSDGKKADLNDPKVVQALQYAVGIYKNEGGYPAVKAAKDASDFFGKGNQFATNTVGAFPMEQWYVNVLADVSPKADLGFTTFKDPSGQTISYSTGSAWAIPAGSKNKAAACRFIKAMTSVASWKAAADARIAAYKKSGAVFTGLQTANTVADADIKKEVSTSDSKWGAAIDAIYTANDHGFTIPANPADAEFQAAWTDAVNKVLTGSMTAQAALDAAQQTAQSALDSAWSSISTK